MKARALIPRRVTVALAAALTLNAVVFGWVLLRPDPFVPLYGYTEQQVELDAKLLPAEVIGVGIGDTDVVYPTYVVSDPDRWPDLPVTGTKCATEPVTVTGRYWWREAQPPGFSSAATEGQASGTAGCSTFRFANRVPDDVRARVIDQAGDGTRFTVWQVQGEETPRGMDGRVGEQVQWTSEAFVIEYRG